LTKLCYLKHNILGQHEISVNFVKQTSLVTDTYSFVYCSLHDDEKKQLINNKLLSQHSQKSTELKLGIYHIRFYFCIENQDINFQEFQFSLQSICLHYQKVLMSNFA